MDLTGEFQRHMKAALCLGITDYYVFPNSNFMQNAKFQTLEAKVVYSKVKTLYLYTLGWCFL